MLTESGLIMETSFRPVMRGHRLFRPFYVTLWFSEVNRQMCSSSFDYSQVSSAKHAFSMQECLSSSARGYRMVAPATTMLSVLVGECGKTSNFITVEGFQEIYCSHVLFLHFTLEWSRKFEWKHKCLFHRWKLNHRWSSQQEVKQLYINVILGYS